MARPFHGIARAVLPVLAELRTPLACGRPSVSSRARSIAAAIMRCRARGSSVLAGDNTPRPDTLKQTDQSQIKITPCGWGEPYTSQVASRSQLAGSHEERPQHWRTSPEKIPAQKTMHRHRLAWRQSPPRTLARRPPKRGPRTTTCCGADGSSSYEIRPCRPA